jgi:hypothetical protein
MPVDSGGYPSVNWRYCVSRKIEPNIAKKTSVMLLLAAEKRGFLKNRMSSIGWSVVSSHHTNAASRAAPATNAATMVVDVQPSIGAWMMP